MAASPSPPHPHPHKFLGATSAQLPGPRAPCALNWRKKNKKPAPNKEQPVPARPGPVGASQLAGLREGRPAGCKRGRESAGLGGRLCPGQQQSPLQDPDPSLHPVKRCGLVSAGGGRRWARRWWDWHQVPRGCPRGCPQLSYPSPKGPQRGWVGRKVALE